MSLHNLVLSLNITRLPKLWWVTCVPYVPRHVSPPGFSKLCHICDLLAPSKHSHSRHELQAWVVLGLLCLVSVEGAGRVQRRRRGKSWHVASSEASCGQSGQINSFHDARPASLCQNYQVRRVKFQTRTVNKIL